MESNLTPQEIESINSYVNKHIEEFNSFDNQMSNEWSELNAIYNNWMEKYHSTLFRSQLPLNLSESQRFFGQSIRELFVNTHLKTNQLGQE